MLLLFVYGNISCVYKITRRQVILSSFFSLPGHMELPLSISTLNQQDPDRMDKVLPPSF